MRKELLTDDCVFQVIEGIKLHSLPPLFDDTTIKKSVKHRKLYTLIFTNGKLVSVGDRKAYTMDDLIRVNFFSDREKKNLASTMIKFYPSIDIINVDYVSVRDADYVIKILIGEEFFRTRYCGGWDYFIQSKDVYMKNPRDRKIRKIVKEVLKMVDEQNGKFKYSEINFNELERVEGPIKKKIR